MGTKRLLACPSCGRHVRIAELACPFCEAPLPLSFANAIIPQVASGAPPGIRLSRGALFALGATSLTLAAACSHPEGVATADASAVTAEAAGRDQGVSSSSDAGQGLDDDDTDGAAVAVYGGPPPDQAK